LNNNYPYQQSIKPDHYRSESNIYQQQHQQLQPVPLYGNNSRNSNYNQQQQQQQRLAFIGQPTPIPGPQIQFHPLIQTPQFIPIPITTTGPIPLPHFYPNSNQQFNPDFNNNQQFYSPNQIQYQQPQQQHLPPLPNNQYYNSLPPQPQQKLQHKEEEPNLIENMSYQQQQGQYNNQYGQQQQQPQQQSYNQQQNYNQQQQNYNQQQSYNQQQQSYNQQQQNYNQQHQQITTTTTTTTNEKKYAIDALGSNNNDNNNNAPGYYGDNAINPNSDPTNYDDYADINPNFDELNANTDPNTTDPQDNEDKNQQVWDKLQRANKEIKKNSGKPKIMSRGSSLNKKSAYKPPQPPPPVPRRPDEPNYLEKNKVFIKNKENLSHRYTEKSYEQIMARQQSLKNKNGYSKKTQQAQSPRSIDNYYDGNDEPTDGATRSINKRITIPIDKASFHDKDHISVDINLKLDDFIKNSNRSYHDLNEQEQHDGDVYNEPFARHIRKFETNISRSLPGSSGSLNKYKTPLPALQRKPYSSVAPHSQQERKFYYDNETSSVNTYSGQQEGNTQLQIS
jgi:hypothetical protein